MSYVDGYVFPESNKRWIVMAAEIRRSFEHFRFRRFEKHSNICK
jgi:hypothetical protein